MVKIIAMKPKLSSFLLMLLGVAALPAADSNSRLTFDSIPMAQFKFAGPVAERVEANIENWLLRAPQSNPGMIEMFRVRDRKPEPQLVPWAGEFVGKYLISAVQALRMPATRNIASYP